MTMSRVNDQYSSGQQSVDVSSHHSGQSFLKAAGLSCRRTTDVSKSCVPSVSKRSHPLEEEDCSVCEERAPLFRCLTDCSDTRTACAYPDAGIQDAERLRQVVRPSTID